MDAENNRQMVVEVVENVVVVLACGVGIEVDGGFALVETGEVQDTEAAECQFEPE